MKYRLMDILACPICKTFPLQIIVFDEKKTDTSTEIVEGILICQNCGRWYPIIEEIPHMLPDELRNKKEDKNFLIKNKEKIPQEILSKGKPFNLSD
ncbi:MAG: Trm112 family protein [archaeon]|nr:Trm112 family protein [archaeon]MCP8313441.1 Trm112 family protein [archaeon]MCP8317958.1 Trm112 family protein [archaeon]MCP8322508.1 Trm112 family protein [archaeon]